jgi:FRG domain
MARRSQHFGSIDEVFALLRADTPPNSFFPDLDEHAYEWITNGDCAQLVPALAHPFLYRGQAARYVPCFPTAFRGLTPVDHPRKLTGAERAKCLLRRVRLEEFLCVLASHPASAFARDLPLVTYPEAIAQHYEMPTDRIDLSQDLAVAAFFATNVRRGDGRWYAMQDGVGVLYRLGIPTDALASPFKGLEWIGRQALPRPGEQRAWTLRLPLGRDFESLPVDIFTFDHHPECGHKLAEKYDGGQTLFPPDILSVLAEEIRSTPRVSRAILNRVLTGYGLPAEICQREMNAIELCFQNQFGVSVTDRDVLSFSPEQLVVAQEVTARLVNDFKGTVRAVRAHRPP